MSQPTIAAMLEYIERSGYDPVVHELDADREVNHYLRSHAASACAVAELGTDEEEENER